jgi:glutamate racemase
VEPYLNYINKERQRADQGRVGVLTTKLTARSARFIELKNRLDPMGKVHVFVPELLADLVEEAFRAGSVTPTLKVRLHQQLEDPYKKNLSTLILGCTHYPLVQNEIEELLGPICVSPAQAVADRIVKLLPPAAPGAQALGHYYFMRTSIGTWSKRTPATTPLWPSPR